MSIVECRMVGLKDLYVDLANAAFTVPAWDASANYHTFSSLFLAPN